MTRHNSTAEIRALDAAHHIHPFTNTRELNEKGARVITKAEGAWLTDSEGNRILDGMSGLWCTAVGYGRQDIVEAVAAQMRELPFYNTFFQTTHAPVAELSQLLSELTPPQFNRFFYCSSGSEANDTIFRLVTYYWHLKGEPQRNVIVSRRGAYHGSTVAAAAVGGFDPMHAQPGLPVGNVFHAPRPGWWSAGGDLSPEAFGRKVAQETLQLIDGIGAARVAAFIAEPIMGAGGVIIPPDSYWPELWAGLKERGILLISDEVICGFGRTGNWFGCETYGTEPDFMTMAKALTSGYVPMGAVAVSDRIAEVLMEKGGEFTHGYTYSGHPAAAAAALVNLRVLRDEKLVERVADDIGPYLQERWRALADHPIVGEAVMTGLVGGLQLCADKDARRAFPDGSDVGMTCREHSFAAGLVMRAVGDRMVVAPPLILSREEADLLVERATQALDRTQADMARSGLF
ncbi:aspartate aminotransferase family protein [Roseibacterium sp. SDUM158017]|uniref:aspartate aminotransferase family protein n=1 Tax=Roseicyclus salinarum TaxID=3036773 RepID=UPI0024151F9E|nr:aspartate aminotransferase family protein [Roseibacterium sp. SDUM158017]MDG4648907.1 aspartate aminotransferase family protein [Roseibacterium sp. SDUM158017]